MTQTLLATTSRAADRGGVDVHSPLAVVSGDSHIGPRLDDLRGYCPAHLLAAFDEYASAHQALLATVANRLAGVLHETPETPEAQALAEQSARIRRAAGGHDVQDRLRQMDRDGVTAEVIYHGTQDGNPIPFVGAGGFVSYTDDARQRSYEGIQIYNRWLADACSVAPGRLLGCVHLPLWDIDESVRQLHWAREAGLRAVNFPAPRRGLAFYDDPVWEPFWSACEELGMVLSTHAGFIDREEVATDGPHEVFLRMIEAGGWLARRAINRLVFGGVFERHPGLKLVLAEQNHDWWSATIKEFDSAYHSQGWQIRGQVPRPPSEYLWEHVFIGASFMAPFEAEAAIRDGYASNVMWGRDYPHLEGTWQELDCDGENPTRLSMRHAFSALVEDHPAEVKAMVSDNGIAIYGLDAADLERVAVEIGAPTLTDLSQPLAALPRPGQGGILSFRTVGPWG